MADVFSKSEYMRQWRARKELENPGHADAERAKARERSNAKYQEMKENPEFMEKERERKRLYAQERRQNAEARASLNARRREIAQDEENKRKQSLRMRKWRSENADHVSEYMKQWRSANADRVKEYSKSYMDQYLKNPDVQKDVFRRNLWKNYKMTTDEFNMIWSAQDGKCKICSVSLAPRGRHNNSVAVDHHHQTGAVRGLLCRMCNNGIGCLQDNPSIIQSAARYLLESGIYGKSEE